MTHVLRKHMSNLTQAYHAVLATVVFTLNIASKDKEHHSGVSFTADTVIVAGDRDTNERIG